MFHVQYQTFADDTLNPVKKALRRAEARPRSTAKSMEDMLTSLSPRELKRRSFFSNCKIRSTLFDAIGIVTLSPPRSGNKRKEDTATETRRISEGEQKNGSVRVFFFSLVHLVTPPKLVFFPSRPTEEEQIGSHGPAGGGKSHFLALKAS